MTSFSALGLASLGMKGQTQVKALALVEKTNEYQNIHEKGCAPGKY